MEEVIHNVDYIITFELQNSKFFTFQCNY